VLLLASLSCLQPQSRRGACHFDVAKGKCHSNRPGPIVPKILPNIPFRIS